MLHILLFNVEVHLLMTSSISLILKFHFETEWIPSGKLRAILLN